MTEKIAEQQRADDSKVSRCMDYDADCLTIENHLGCYLYDPGKGYCPFLRTLKDDLE